MTKRKTTLPFAHEVAYPSGPMRGYPDYNYATFREVGDALVKAGATVLNPIDNFGGELGLPFEQYMQQDIQHVLDASIIVMLPGWERSEGAKLELQVAIASGKRIFIAHRSEESAAAGLGAYNGWYFTEEPEPKFLSEGIDHEARRIVYGVRNETYGPPRDDFEVIGYHFAGTLTAYLGHKVAPIPPEIVAIMMTGLKLARLGFNPGHRDSRVDSVGYILCLDRIVNNE